MEFEPVIGLEIHTQLATASKLFCGCSTAFGAPPNGNTCPVCMGLPGVLPVVNRRAVELAVRLGLAAHCRIRLDSQFARKNYFYPDLPKAYQISQYDRPLCEGGYVDVAVNGHTKRVRLTRIHMEEDAGKLVHEGRDPNASYVDLNRAGTPLVEIVSEPDIRSAEEARLYMEHVHTLVTDLGVSNGNMEQGNLRADANVSLRPKGSDTLGTRAEIKNVNSFRFVQQAIEYEIERQRAELLEGRSIVQETRLFDPLSRTTYAMRSKEEAHDYRYFPEPDLPVLRLEQAWVEQVRAGLPELRKARAARFQGIGLSEYDANILVKDPEKAAFFETSVAPIFRGGRIPSTEEILSAGGINEKESAATKAIANWINGELSAKLNADGTRISDHKRLAEGIGELVGMISKGEISGKMAKEVFDVMYAEGKAPAQIVQERGLQQVSDVAALETLVAQVIADNPEQVAQYRGGRTKVIGFFVGRIMQATGGQANPGLVN
ncbi:MAG: Asp-tRNA(Asn)/Glu-tRNA(Gln) amidotransferase subunit GatB, partial [Candidatus Lambdaproteobacteria bacterium]|nr:Asp-tRNA(Asn)/Glu-tRNA(Gln) amidotransferase subunit GatB [Candidatus Lambdaproteobacteria bacterium]